MGVGVTLGVVVGVLPVVALPPLQSAPIRMKIESAKATTSAIRARRVRRIILSFLVIYVQKAYRSRVDGAITSPRKKQLKTTH